MMYEGFAGAYDCLMADVDYDAWARHYLEIAAEMGVKVQRAADCACDVPFMPGIRPLSTMSMPARSCPQSARK